MKQKKESKNKKFRKVVEWNHNWIIWFTILSLWILLAFNFRSNSFNMDNFGYNLILPILSIIGLTYGIIILIADFIITFSFRKVHYEEIKDV